MISVIVCSRQNPADETHKNSVLNTIGTPCEYIRINNRDNAYNLCSAYNTGVSLASGDIIVFVHEDVFFVNKDWGVRLIDKFADASVGLVGVAGTQYLFKDTPGWVAAGRPWIKGQVIHETHGIESRVLTVFSWDDQDADVVAVDGLFFAIRASLFSTIRFDDITFNGFHLYDLDICMQIQKSHRLIVTKDILVRHLSGGSFDTKWQSYAVAFLKKYSNRLPVSCVSTVPDLSKRIHFENVNLQNVMK
ncbi:MAG: glycosyltransferase [Fibrobacterota bacterium]|nr:glycosyltransferase [Chitinispirillaceae bacterium]